MQFAILCSRKLFSDYEQSVIELANKLPQWNPETAEYERRFNSSISSLFEETGELSGLTSKYRIRKKYWKSKPKDLADYEEIRLKFMSEASDLLWVIVCSNYCLGNIVNDIFGNISQYINQRSKENYIEDDNENNFEQSLYEIFSSLVLIRSTSIFDDRDIRYYMIDLIKTFSAFLIELYKEYSISLTDMINYNMNKLGNRYDANGQRTDGK